LCIYFILSQLFSLSFSPCSSVFPLLLVSLPFALWLQSHRMRLDVARLKTELSKYAANDPEKLVRARGTLCAYNYHRRVRYVVHTFTCKRRRVIVGLHKRHLIYMSTVVLGAAGASEQGVQRGRRPVTLTTLVA
jgi:hypothetical protein